MFRAESSLSGPQPQARIRWHLVAPGIAVALFTILVVFTAWLGDDAYITFRTIDNLRHGYGLRWNAAERVQTFTHPLWLFALSGAWGITGEHYFSSLGLSIGCSALAATVVAFRVARNWAGGAIAVALLIVSRATVDYSTSGLENPLSHLLLALFVVAYWTPNRPPRRVGAVVALGALAAVNRLDLGLLVAPALVHSAFGGGRPAWKWTAAGALPLVAWEAFSIVYYGFPFPNTAYAKLPPNIMLLELIPQGLTYLADSLQNDPVTVLTIAFALLVTIAADSDTEQVMLAGGVFAYLAYVVSVGGDFMSGRFLTPPFLVAVGIVARRRAPALRSPSLLAAAILVVLGVATSLPRTLVDPPPADPTTFVRPDGIADERRVYSPETRLTQALLRRQAPVTASERSGLRLRRLKMSPQVLVAVGCVGYGAGPDVFILDQVGLGDPLMARLPADHPWRIGHFRREPPDGYLETATTGQGALTDPLLARYYQQLALITRGPIWSRERWAAIVQVNLGRIGPTR